MDYSRNGKHLLIASAKGHLAMIEWKKKELICEFHVKQRVRDCQYL